MDDLSQFIAESRKPRENGSPYVKAQFGRDGSCTLIVGGDKTMGAFKLHFDPDGQAIKVEIPRVSSGSVDYNPTPEIMRKIATSVKNAGQDRYPGALSVHLTKQLAPDFGRAFSDQMRTTAVQNDALYAIHQRNHKDVARTQSRPLSESRQNQQDLPLARLVAMKQMAVLRGLTS